MKHVLILFFLLSAGIAQGQIATSIGPGPGQDLFQRNLYSADKVMGMREELDLTDAQVANIKKAYSKNAGEFSTIKWDLDEATTKLKNLLNLPKIDQVAVQKQMDTVLKLENQLKKMQLDNLVAIKNELTEDQQKILQKNSFFIVKDASQGLSVRGYLNSSDAAMSLKGSKYRVGQPGYAMTWDSDKVSTGQVATGPGVSVYVAGSDQNDQPLYYIDTKDGMKQVKSFEDINPKEIESMEVLKGDKAIEKFGKKAENGAIVIKLKNEPK
jgi:Spy/CpxP family protein refolding chaperone